MIKGVRTSIFIQEQIVKDYLEGVFQIDLASKYNLSPITIKKILVNYNLDFTPKREKYRDLIIIDLLEGLPVKPIMKKYAVSYSFVCDIAEQAKIIPAPPVPWHKLFDEQEQDAVSLYKSCEVTNQFILDKYDIDIVTLYRILKRYKVALRGCPDKLRYRQPSRYTAEQQASIVLAYKLGTTIKELIQEWECSYSWLLDILKKNGIKLDKRGAKLKLEPQKDNIIADYKAGFDILQLAKKYKVHVTTVESSFYRWGLNKMAKYNINTDEDIEESWGL